MADARKTWAQLDVLFGDNTAGAISPQDLRDGFQSLQPHEAAAAPTVNDDETAGFDVGHKWVDTSEPAIYECRDGSTGAAVWTKLWPVTASVAWGDITGTLGDQTDLQSALDAKAASSHSHTLSDITDAGTAAASDTGDFATAAQGALADTAVQPGDNADTLGSGAATSGQVLTADGGGDSAWVTPSGGGGIDPADGLVIEKHGAVAGTTRPTAGTVYWMGSVAPTNKQLGDMWLETGAYD